jgi:putative iron-regulated protein
MFRLHRLLAATALVAIGGAPAAAETVDQAAVLATYADIAHATYEDSLIAARELQAAVGALLAEPGEATHQAAKDA